MSKKSFIDSVEVKHPCSEDWNNMHGTDKIRFCSHCATTVNNLSEMTRKQAMRLVRASNGKLCIRYIADPRTKRPLFAEQLLQITRRAPSVAAGVISASLSLATLTFGQGEPASVPRAEAAIEKQLDTSEATKSEAGEELPGIIQGIIRDYAGNPVSDVSLILNRADESRYGFAEAKTDRDGVYKFEGLEPGAYMVRVVSSSGKWQKTGPAITLSSSQTVIQDINVRVIYRKPGAGDENISYSGSGFGIGGAIASVEYSLPLSRAVADEDLAKVRELLNAGARVNGHDSNYDDITPLFIAVENGDVPMVRFLLQNGAKINARDKQKRTPLMFIDDDATPELIRIMLQAGASVSLHDEAGTTPLFSAVTTGKVELIQVLIDAGADVNIDDENGETVLMRAVDGGHVDIVKALIVAGSDVNARDDRKESAWDKTSDAEMEKVLVEAGAIAYYDVEIEKELPAKPKKSRAK
ncbi:MAG: ankyrin repeat domain-containing protein [Pyrinomonadaceae bacterium]